MAVSNSTRQNLTLLGVVILAFAIPLTLVAIKIAGDIRSSAKPTETPTQVFVTNLSNSSATITWITKENETEGFVKYGTSAETITSAEFDERDGSTTGIYKTHSVQIAELEPSKEYHYKIVVGDQEYDNAGTPFTFTTLPSPDSAPNTPDPVEGSVTPSGENVIVYSFASNGTSRSTVVSALTNSSGNFAFDRTSLKNSTSGEQFSLTNADIVTYAQGAELGTNEVQYIATEKPDLLNLSTSGSTEFNPDKVVTLLERPGGPVTPPPTTTPSILITSSTNLSGADSDPTIPRNVRISNVSDTSFTVTWLTREASTGSVLFGASTPDTVALDDRDGSVSLAKKRFTHSATVTDSTLVEGDKVVFQISSNSKLYGSTTGNFEFTIPKLLSSPPSLKVVTGTVEPEFESTIGLPESRDFLIVGRLSNAGENSSWVSTVPAANKGWNLNTAQARSQELDEYFATTGSQTNLELYGAFNSAQTTSLTSEESYDFAPGVGLSVSSFNHNEEISVLEPITGTAEPGKTVVLTFSGPESKTVTTIADANGEWEASISTIEASGEYDIVVQSESSVLGLSADVTLEALPDTAIRDVLPYIPSVALIITGIGIIYWVKQSKLRKYE